MPRAPAAAAALLAVWLLVDPRTPDLAAQVYRVGLFRREGFAVFDLRWYAGHHLPGYSLIFPQLATVVGMRVLAALAVLASAILCERLLLAVFGEAARWGAVWFALAAVADVWIGRLTFALGVALALTCLLAFVRGRMAVAVIAAVLCAAASPVAGVLLGFAAVTQALVVRSPRALLVVAAPAATLVVVVALIFPEGGWEPYPTTSFVATVAVVLGFLWALPSGWPELRLGALLYLGACLACVALRSPLGANVERYGILLAGPLLLCAVWATRGDSRGDRGVAPGPAAGGSGARVPAGRVAPGTLVVLCGIALWTVWGPVRETAAVAGDPSTGAAYYVPVERFLAAHGGKLRRVEVPFTRGHWEAARLASSFSLARGWEKQLDTRYDEILLRPGLTAAGYLGWLRQEAVTYIALPDAPLDPSSSREGRLIRSGLPDLEEVLVSPHWRVFRVLDPTPLLEGRGRLTALGQDSFAFAATAPGSFLVRVRYTRYWIIARGSGCVTSAPGGWTSVTVSRPGPVVVAARFSLGRALGLQDSSCAQPQLVRP